MDGYIIIIILIFVLLLMASALLWLVDTVFFHSGRLAKLQEENKYLRQLIQDEYLLDNDGMEAFNKMFSAACLHGFRENAMDEDI